MPDLFDISNGQTMGDMPVDFTGTSVIASGVSPGWHKLYVTYQDPKIHNCFHSPVPTFFIDSLADLSFTSSSNSVKCPNFSDGSIDLTITAGAGNYTISKGKDTITGQSSVSFTGLSADTYYVSISDKCITKSQTLILTAPNPVTLDINSTFSPNCLMPSNGRIPLTASGGTGSTFDYYIYSGNTIDPLKLTDSIKDATGVVTWEKAAAGDYLVNLRDHTLPGCPGVTRTATVPGFTPLTLTQPDITNGKCFGDLTGKIQANANGGSGNYRYSLRGYDNSYNVGSSVNSLFENLPAGTYNLVARNNNTCLDSAVIPAVVQSNPRIGYLVDKTDVTCSDKTDASLGVNLTVANYSWVWEKRTTDGWDIVGNNSALLPGLDSGLYRVNITQIATNCKADSVVLISKPTPLVFDSIRFAELKCFGDSNYFRMYSSGGNAGHIYQYNRDNTGWANYSSNTALPDGSYLIRVTDQKSCFFEQGTPFMLSSPVKPFSINPTYSNYNGTSISCFGKNDGWVTIEASGGNGGTYTGYTCILNDTLTQNSLLFGKLKAGFYTLKVFDARGCMKPASFELTQPLSDIKLFVDKITNIKCAEDATGQVQLQAQGNDEPFLYSCNDGPFYPSNLFNNLPAGNYRFYTKDNKGCLQYVDTSVVALLPKMVFGGEISHVKCKGDNSGFVNVSISGGSGSYSYYWIELGTTTRFVSGLPQGNYSVKVTDSMGCSQSARYFIKEPSQELGLDIVTKPVCAGTTQGLIKTLGKGGTPPYKWTVNNISAIGEMARYSVAPGQYTVHVADSNNCVDSRQVNIEVRNQMPDMNFMVATSRYELDTLVIKDVSMPKPDSISWMFSPGTKIIDKGDTGARIQYTQFGEYPVVMIGWYSGCDYSINKTIQIEPIESYKPPKNIGITGFENITLKPNPNNGSFSVDFTLYSTERVLIKIVDMYSKVVYQQNIAPTIGHEQFISLSKVPSGTYLLVMVSETDSRSVRFIISK